MMIFLSRLDSRHVTRTKGPIATSAPPFARANSAIFHARVIEIVRSPHMRFLDGRTVKPARVHTERVRVHDDDVARARSVDARTETMSTRA
jgi:hypothetical protein